MRCHQQVNVISHQDIGVHGGGVPHRSLLETRQVEAIIVLMKEDRLTIMPALDNVLRNARQGVAG